MAQVYIYGDESGKFEVSDYVSMCGYVGRREDWQVFSDRWVCELTRLELPPIHMSQLFSPSPNPKKKWRQIMDRFTEDDWPGERERIADHFAELVSRSSIYAVGAVVDSRHFRSLPDSDFKTFYKDPVFFGLYNLLMSGIRRIEPLSHGGFVGFVVDDDATKACEFYRRFDELRQMPHDLCRQIATRVTAITFARDEAFPGVQAADMLAFEACKLMRARQVDPTAESSARYEMLTHGNRRWPMIFDSKKLDRMAQGERGKEGI